jgi:radical SAM protein with 4Fe4S-binding SPASM domain
MGVLRAKTIDLKQIGDLTHVRKQNSLLNESEADQQKKMLSSYPRRLVFELTNACNLNCVMCGRNAANFKLTRFDIGWLDIFNSCINKVEEVTLMGWGEPTTHPKFKEFLYWAHANGLRKYFCTNGMNLDLFSDDIVNAEVDIIAVSIDSSDAVVNDKIRKGADLERIIKNIRIIKRGKISPYMNFVFTAMQSNLTHLLGVIKLAKDVGVEEVKVVYLTAFDSIMEKEVLWGYEDKVKRVFGDAIVLAEKCGVALKLPHVSGEDPAARLYHKTCFTGWRDFFLGSDGFVRACMSTSEKLFNIEKYSGDFDKMWNSDELVSHRTKVNSENMSNSCKRCYQSSFANWNNKQSFIQKGSDFSPDWL